MFTVCLRPYAVFALAALLVLTASIGLFGQSCPAGTTNSIVTTSATADPANLQIKSTNIAAQTFTTPGSTSDCYRLSAVTFSVLKDPQTNGGPGDLIVTVYTVDSGTEAPASPIASASAIVLAAEVGTNLADKTVSFSNPPSLVGGTMYAIVFSSGSSTGSNNYKVGVVQVNPGGPYAGGSYWINDGSGWALAAGGKQDVRMAFCFTPCPSGGCTLTQGYWKTHGPEGCVTGNNTNQWPVAGLQLGTESYTDAGLCGILNTAPAGNGLLTLAHQLIAAKLNIANGADPSAISSAVAAADALIGSSVIPPVGSGSLTPEQTGALTGTLTSYNEGTIGPGHCEE